MSARNQALLRTLQTLKADASHEASFAQVCQKLTQMIGVATRAHAVLFFPLVQELVQNVTKHGFAKSHCLPLLEIAISAGIFDAPSQRQLKQWLASFKSSTPRRFGASTTRRSTRRNHDLVNGGTTTASRSSGVRVPPVSLPSALPPSHRRCVTPPPAERTPIIDPNGANAHKGASKKRSFAMARFPFKFWVKPEPLSPVRLQHADGIGTFKFKFALSKEWHSALEACQQSSEPEGPWGDGRRFDLRIVLFTDVCQGKYSVPHPDGLSFALNGVKIAPHVYSAQDPCDRFFGIDATHAARAGINELAISIDRCMCVYRFGVRLLERLSDTSLVARVQHNFATRTGTESRGALAFASSLTAVAAAEVAKQRVIASFAAHNDDGLQETSVRASLRDPLTLCRLAVPVRGKQCTCVVGGVIWHSLTHRASHAQCFDLHSYIAFQRTDIRFLCPVCTKPAPISELAIDAFFVQVLRELDSHVDDIVLYPDGTVQVYGEAALPPVKRRRVAARADDTDTTATAAAALTLHSTSSDDHDGDTQPAALLQSGGTPESEDADAAIFAKLKQQMIIDLTE